MSLPPYPIVLKSEPLSADFLPIKFIGREHEVQEVLDHLTEHNANSPCVGWIHGPPGSGKSSIAKWALNELEDRHVATAYVNCASKQTFFAVLQAILTDLGVIVRAARDTAFKLERLHALARKSPVAIVVDDLDLMLPKDRSLLLVNLCQLPNTKLVCLTQTRETYVHLDPRVQSRIQPRFIRFSEYPIRDLVRILHARAEQSLADGSWSHADLVAIVDASRGDARVAIQALHAAACSAEKHWSPQLRSKDIHDGLAAASPLHRRYLLNMLSDHHRLIYSIIKRAGEIPLPHAWGAYQKLAREQGMPPMSRRTFNEYRQYMVTIKLLAEQQATGRGNVLLLRVVQ